MPEMIHYILALACDDLAAAESFLEKKLSLTGEQKWDSNQTILVQPSPVSNYSVQSTSFVFYSTTVRTGRELSSKH